MRRTIDGLIVLLFILHYLIFPIRMGRERFFIAQKAVNISQTALPATPHLNDLTSFELSGYLGYIDKEIQLQSRIFLQDRVAHNAQGYVVYQEQNAQNSYFTADGKQMLSVLSEGVPILHKDRVYFVNSLTGEVQAYHADGQLLWEYDVGAFISAFDVNDELVAIGDLNGFLTLVSAQGAFISRHDAPGSAYQGVYGVRLSPSSQYVAAMIGLNQQRFVLFRRGVNGYTPILHERKLDELRRTVAIFFDEDEKFVYYEGENKLFILQITDNVREKMIRKLSLEQERFVHFMPNLMQDFFMVSSTSGTSWRLQIYSRDREYLFANIAYESDDKPVIWQNGDGIIIGMQRTLMEVKWQTS